MFDGAGGGDAGYWADDGNVADGAGNTLDGAGNGNAAAGAGNDNTIDGAGNGVTADRAGGVIAIDGAGNGDVTAGAGDGDMVYGTGGSDAGDRAGDGDVADGADNAVDTAICNSSLPSATSCNDPTILVRFGTSFTPPLMYGVVCLLCTADHGPVVSVLELLILTHLNDQYDTKPNKRQDRFRH
eukprot:6188948-Pleurochrysis_carterae.AAC.2